MSSKEGVRQSLELEVQSTGQLESTALLPRAAGEGGTGTVREKSVRAWPLAFSGATHWRLRCPAPVAPWKRQVKYRVPAPHLQAPWQLPSRLQGSMFAIDPVKRQ